MHAHVPSDLVVEQAGQAVERYARQQKRLARLDHPCHERSRAHGSRGPHRLDVGSDGRIGFVRRYHAHGARVLAHDRRDPTEERVVQRGFDDLAVLVHDDAGPDPEAECFGIARIQLNGPIETRERVRLPAKRKECHTAIGPRRVIIGFEAKRCVKTQDGLLMPLHLRFAPLTFGLLWTLALWSMSRQVDRLSQREQIRKAESMAEIRSLKSEIRGQRSEVRDQRSDIRDQKVD